MRGKWIIFIILQSFILIFPVTSKTINKDEKFLKLLKAYPDHLSGIQGDYLVWKDGTKMLIDDKITGKTFKELLNFPDLEDQLSLNYPGDNYMDKILQENNDPGRIRYEPFFFKMYGKNKNEIEKNLVEITWLPETSPKKLWVTKINDVHKKLIAISDELEKLSQDMKLYVNDPAGVYCFREIKGTTRVSVHSFGIAIDLNIKFANYWIWDKEINGKLEYKNQYPYEIVKIFEKYGFIWGGKWYHYDTMHFEYRPELIN